ncbi:MAG: DUF2188 domain-containing protein [Actinomycetota bacterium]
MSKKGNVWTGPHPEGGWANRVEGNEKASSKHETKSEAVTAGRDRARKDHVEHFVQDQKGQIQSRNSYGGDPPRRRG